MKATISIASFIIFFSFYAHSNDEQIERTVVFESIGGEQHEEKVTLSVINGLVHFEGDQLVGKLLEDGTIKPLGQMISFTQGTIGTKSLVTSNSSQLWTNGVVSYTISGFGANSQSVELAVEAAIDNIESNSGVRFVERTYESNYVKIEPGIDHPSCRSEVGMVGGAQSLFLVEGRCTDPDESNEVGIIIHELMHALGFRHMHSRSDRNQYVTVHYENILEEFHYQYDERSSGVTIIGPYDSMSIMHYSSFNSLKAVDPTLPVITNNSGLPNEMRGHTLSDGDIEALGELYGFYEKPEITVLNFYCYGQAEIHWDNISGADVYEVQRDIGYGWGAYSSTTNTSIFVNSSGSADYRVLACDLDGNCSKHSNEEYVFYYEVCH